LEEVSNIDVISSKDTCAVQMFAIKAIQLKNIEYSNDQHKIFNKLSYQFDKGKIYLIEGESGQGKTTLLKLIAGIIPCDKGQVLWGTNLIGDVATQSKQRLLSWMTQSSYFIEGSLQDNITLFSPSIDMNKLELAFKNSACDFLTQQNRAELLLESSALCLSGGQAQRLNLARAIYHGGSIRLFDEPSANLDENTEHQVFQSICQQKQNHISIIVSHRKSIRQYVDKVLCLRDGKLVDALESNHL
jgi:ABC-type transport system involved in cytochrome bd biosynthesis fused ATPase/permease subunit